MTNPQPDSQNHISENDGLPTSSTDERRMALLLVQMQPEAKAAYRDNLEDFLAEQLRDLHMTTTHKEQVTMPEKYKNNPSREVKQLRLSLAGALFALFLFGFAGFMMFFCQDAWCGSSLPAANSVSDEILNPMQVVIAAQDISYGVEITEDMLTTITIEPTLRDRLQMNDETFYADEALIVGQRAVRRIEMLAPIASDVVQRTGCVNADDPCVILPADMVAIAFPQTNNLVYDPGTLVDVYAAMKFVEAGDGFQSPEDLTGIDNPMTVVQRVITEALLVAVDREQRDEPIVTLAVSAQDAATLQFLLETQTPIWLTPYAEGSTDAPVRVTSIMGGNTGNTDVIVHQIRHDDTLLSIAARYGIDPQAIIDLNDLEDDEQRTLRPDDYLLIPVED